MESPSNLLLKLSRSIFADTAEKEKFIHAVNNPQAFNPAILWLPPKPTENPFNLEIPVSWQPEFVARLALESQPENIPYIKQEDITTVSTFPQSSPTPHC